MCLVGAAAGPGTSMGSEKPRGLLNGWDIYPEACLPESTQRYKFLSSLTDVNYFGQTYLRGCS